MNPTNIITPACPECGQAMQHDEARRLLVCEPCDIRRGSRSWFSDQGQTRNVVFSKRGPAKEFPRRFDLQCTDAQRAKILANGGAEYIRRLIDADGEICYTAV